MASTTTPITAGTAPTLRRSLGLWDLILYGIVVIQPTAPMPVFGVVSDRAHGHVVTAVLIAMFAMLFTAISYGRMARAYPSAGSAFTYVGQEIHPALGYMTGWGMVNGLPAEPADLHHSLRSISPKFRRWCAVLRLGGVFCGSVH
jgi:amino acid transporter